MGAAMPNVEAESTLLARKAAEASARLERAAATGRQLSLLPTPASPADPGEIERAGPGRPQGAKGKKSSKLRQMLAARGYRMPEDMLAELAGLNSRLTAVELAMHRAEQVLEWAFEGQTPLPGQRLATFLAIHKDQQLAASALLPFGLERMTPDQAAAAPPTVLVLPGRAADARPFQVIDGQAEALDMAPPPMPAEGERDEP